MGSGRAGAGRQRDALRNRTTAGLPISPVARPGQPRQYFDCDTFETVPLVTAHVSLRLYTDSKWG
jgi:hypothetical protein